MIDEINLLEINIKPTTLIDSKDYLIIEFQSDSSFDPNYISIFDNLPNKKDYEKINNDIFTYVDLGNPLKPVTDEVN